MNIRSAFGFVTSSAKKTAKAGRLSDPCKNGFGSDDTYSATKPRETTPICSHETNILFPFQMYHFVKRP